MGGPHENDRIFGITIFLTFKKYARQNLLSGVFLFDLRIVILAV